MTTTALERLAANGPYTPHQDDLMLYGRLVGTWDVEWTRFAQDGTPAEQRQAEWHFGWILGGRGVQDVIWQKGDPPHLDGTTIRCYDAEHRLWRLAFMSPHDGEFVTMTGRAGPDHGSIVQDLDGRPNDRWTFDGITAATFRWQAHHDDRVTHQMLARRR